MMAMKAAKPRMRPSPKPMKVVTRKKDKKTAGIHGGRGGTKEKCVVCNKPLLAHERRYKTNVCHHACGLAQLAADRQVKKEAGGKEKLKKLKEQDPERYSMIVAACNSKGKKKARSRCGWPARVW